jgi:hypothetical protein
LLPLQQGVPLEVLDLRACDAADHAIQFLAEIVVDVQGPLVARQMAMENLFEYLMRCRDEVGYEDMRRGPWYYALESDGEDEDEGESESENDDEDESDEVEDESDEDKESDEDEDEADDDQFN